jgi:hypothetical protein
VLTVDEWLELIPSFQRAMQDLFSRGSLLALGLVVALIAFGADSDASRPPIPI